MAGKKPLLVLQMQRMGDLILSFPLLLWLQRRFPGHPIYVVAEPMFYKPLIPLAPQVHFLPWTNTQKIKEQNYELVINLSIRQPAALLTGEVTAQQTIGPREERGIQHIDGPWQLYRASLVENNQYNRFHWADLNALDIITPETIGKTRFDEPRTLPSTENRVGLFLGASEAAKRPSAHFWAALMNELLKRNLRPILFGGPAEVELAHNVLQLFNGPALNYCGKLGLGDFAKVGQSLALFITPDTGPMHLAAWTGLKCLNLSMGPVQPWETGPYQPGHFVLRATADKAKTPPDCQEETPDHSAFEPRRVAVLVARIIAGDTTYKLSRLQLPGLDLLQTSRGATGLYHLETICGALCEHRLLGRFWSAWFGWQLGNMDQTQAKQGWHSLREKQPAAAKTIFTHIPAISRQFRHGLRTGDVLNQDFWEESPPTIKPLTGFAHMLLQNEDYSQQAWKKTMKLLEGLLEISE